MTSSAQTTVCEPSPTDPRVVAALAAQKHLQEVMQADDFKGIEALMAPDLLVNAPINKVANRDNVIGRIQANQISYEPDVTRNIEYAGVRGEVVVIMGEEVVHPNKDAIRRENRTSALHGHLETDGWRLEAVDSPSDCHESRLIPWSGDPPNCRPRSR